MKKSTTHLTTAQKIHADYVARGDLLDTREKDIIEKYYGFGGHLRHSLEEIAKDYKITRERVRQIKHYATKKIAQV